MTTVNSTELTQVFTAEYEPVGFVRNYMPAAPHHRPLFTSWAIEQMLQDPRIVFGLELIKGPIHAFTKFFSQEEASEASVHKMIVETNIEFPYVVQCDDKEIEQYITKSIRRFWQTGAIKALNALEWGYSGCEVIYKRQKSGRKPLLVYDTMKDLDPRDIRCVTLQGGIIGLDLHPTRASGGEFIGIPKAFWHVHARERNRYHGHSRLFGAYAAWWEIWGEGGARDIRRNWFHRNAFDGGEMRYPMGYTKLPDGTRVENRDLALEMLSKKRSGGYMVFPQQDLNGKQAWEYTPPVASVEPQGMQSYMASLTSEELEGLGIPPEVIEGGGGGLGSSSGREIPMTAYLSTLRKIADFLIQDFSAQVLDYLIALNFRKSVDYDIIPLVPTKAFEEEIKEPPISSQEKSQEPEKKEPEPKPAPTE